MATQLAVPSSRLSPIAAQELYDRETVKRVKRQLVRANYSKALTLGNQYLLQQIKDNWKGPLNYFQTTIKLESPFPCHDDGLESLRDSSSLQETGEYPQQVNFEVRLGAQLTAVDEIAAVVLQAWFELLRREGGSRDSNISSEAWKHLQPVLCIYSLHPMPLELFAEIWVPFWDGIRRRLSNLDCANLALQWNLQVASFLLQLDSVTASKKQHLIKSRDQLLEYIFVKQLPRLKSVATVHKLATTFLNTPSHQLPENLFRVSESLEDNSRSDALLHIKEALSLPCPEDTEDRFPNDLRERILQNDCFTEILLGAPSRQLSMSGARLSFGGYGLQAVMQSFVRNFRSKVESLTRAISMSTISSKDGLQESRELQLSRWRIALSIFSILLAWKHRYGMKQFGKYLVAAMLAPIAELVEALRPANSIAPSPKLPSTGTVEQVGPLR